MRIIFHIADIAGVPKRTDIGEKSDLPDVVLGRDELSQPAVIAGKGNVFVGRHVG
jgi:hypothetical protein